MKCSGFLAWWLWRTIYLMKLPGLDRKIRVALDWTLDLIFSKDIVQFVTDRAPTLSHETQGLAETDHAIISPTNMGHPTQPTFAEPSA